MLYHIRCLEKGLRDSDKRVAILTMSVDWMWGPFGRMARVVIIHFCDKHWDPAPRTAAPFPTPSKNLRMFSSTRLRLVRIGKHPKYYQISRLSLSGCFASLSSTFYLHHLQIRRSSTLIIFIYISIYGCEMLTTVKVNQNINMGSILHSGDLGHLDEIMLKKDSQGTVLGPTVFFL